MELDTFLQLWTYYISLEKQAINTVHFATPTNKNKSTYSEEFCKIIFLCCSEIEALLQKYCELFRIQPSGKNYTMKDYVKALEKLDLRDTSKVISYFIFEGQEPLHLSPFVTLDKTKPHANLGWWRDYQQLKHSRLKNFKKATLFNANSCLAALFILLRKAIESHVVGMNGKEYYKENCKSNYFSPCK